VSLKTGIMIKPFDLAYLSEDISIE
jgi:hypothetical protein